MLRTNAFSTAALWLVCACGTDATGPHTDTSPSAEPTTTSGSFDGTHTGGSPTDTASGSGNTSYTSADSSLSNGSNTSSNGDVGGTSSDVNTSANDGDPTTPSDTRADASATTDGTVHDSTSSASASSEAATSESSNQGSSDGTEGNTDGECELSGNVRYRINDPASFPADALEKLTKALDEAIYYYNCYSDLDHSLTINYNPNVRTAEGNVDGVISFGSDRDYMVVATVMHEFGHTMGVGYAPWSQLIQDQRWVGPHVVEYMTNLPANQRDPDSYSQRTYITCDGQHFWPYGLNQTSEHQSEWSLINHVRIVAAMNKDKDAYR